MTTEKADHLSVIVPVFNEAASLPEFTDILLDTLNGLGGSFEVVFVNDGSTDDSATLLDEIAASSSRIKVVHFRRNFGQTAAMMAGLDYSTGDVIVPIDADLQNDPRDTFEYY